MNANSEEKNLRQNEHRRVRGKHAKHAKYVLSIEFDTLPDTNMDSKFAFSKHARTRAKSQPVPTRAREQALTQPAAQEQTQANEQTATHRPNIQNIGSLTGELIRRARHAKPAKAINPAPQEQPSAKKTSQLTAEEQPKAARVVSAAKEQPNKAALKPARSVEPETKEQPSNAKKPESIVIEITQDAPKQQRQQPAEQKQQAQRHIQHKQQPASQAKPQPKTDPVKKAAPKICPHQIPDIQHNVQNGPQKSRAEKAAETSKNKNIRASKEAKSSKASKKRTPAHAPSHASSSEQAKQVATQAVKQSKSKVGKHSHAQSGKQTATQTGKHSHAQSGKAQSGSAQLGKAQLGSAQLGKVQTGKQTASQVKRAKRKVLRTLVAAVFVLGAVCVGAYFALPQSVGTAVNPNVQVSVFYDSQGGSSAHFAGSATTTCSVNSSKTYGEATFSDNNVHNALPTTERKGYKFVGWFTQPDGGAQVTASTQVEEAQDHTLYAHWTRDSLYF